MTQDTTRCAWAGPEQIYVEYHDTEWGVPEYDSRALWEKLILDGFQALLGNAGIIRHRGKIQAAITNAQAWQRIEAEQGFDTFMWDYVGGKPLQNRFASQADVPPKTELSEKVSKDLKKAGFKFCGPTIVYAWMEACGLVNDHLVGCHRHSVCAALGR